MNRENSVKSFIPHSFAYKSAESQGTFNGGRCKNIGNPIRRPIAGMTAKELEEYRIQSLCENRKKALEYAQLSGRDALSEQTSEDAQKRYNEEVATAVNLTLGSLVLLGFVVQRIYRS